jgi:FdhD protein
MTRHPTTPATIVAVRERDARSRPDRVVTEEPMEIRVAGPGQDPQRVAVVMRTPTADFELAVGFLFTEGLIGAGDVREVRYCELPADAEQQFNVVTVRLAQPWQGSPRQFDVGSSCGVCGRTSLEEVAQRSGVVPPGPTVAGSVIASLPARLRDEQRLFDSTGGLHGAGLFSSQGYLIAAREDVGRHNAVDKIVGHAVLGGFIPLAGHVLAVSGRISFEIVEKAALAGIGIIGAVSAPTSLAIAAADRAGLTLAGFIREGGYNVYTHAGRIDPRT